MASESQAAGTCEASTARREGVNPDAERIIAELEAVKRRGGWGGRTQGRPGSPAGR